MSGKITLYFSETSGNKAIKKQQLRIKSMLDAHKISYEVTDVAQDQEVLDKMRALVHDDSAVAPQIANGDKYCGNFDGLKNAVEMGELGAFLKLE